VTAAVERGDLVRTATLRLTIQRETRLEVPLPTQPDDPAVVTAQPVVSGQTLAAGAVATELNGRPVIALPGQFPYYRDLTVGDRGPDVDQLQRGMMAAGLLHGHDGVFGEPTERAIKRLYSEAHSHAPIAPTATDPSQQGSDATPERVMVRPSDLVVVDELPATVVASPAVGTIASADTGFTLERGSTHAVADISSAAAAGLTVGTSGTARVGDVPVPVRVAAVGGDTGARDTRRVTVVGADAPLPDDLVGNELVASLDVHVAARDALLIPSSAVIPGGDNAAYVLVRRRQDLQRVPVEELGTLDGRSAVRPLRAGSLESGDKVRVP